MVALNDFTLLRRDRSRHGGGVAMFIRETIDFKHCTYLQPPKYEHETLNELEILLKTIENENKEIILMGDVNCDNLHIEDRSKVIDHLRGLCRQF